MTTKSYKNHAESAGRVKQRQREGTGPNKGTVRERKRASPADSRRTDYWQGPWSTVASHSTNHTVSEQRHGSGDTGKEHKEKTGEQRTPQRRTGCGLLSCPSDSEVLEEKRVKARITLDQSAAGRRSGGRGKTEKWPRKTGGQDDRQEEKPLALASKTGREGRGRGKAIKVFFFFLFFFFPAWRWWPVVPRTAQPGRSQPTQREVRGRGNWRGTGSAAPVGPSRRPRAMIGGGCYGGMSHVRGWPRWVWVWGVMIKLMVPRTALNGRPRTTWNKGGKGVEWG